MDQDTIATDLNPADASPAWKALLRDEIDRALVRGGGRWSRALMAVAWIHLLAFIVCHTLT